MNLVFRQSEEADLGDEPGGAERRDDADDTDGQEQDRSETQNDPIFGPELGPMF
jgi:hypothetical protein